MGITLSNIQTGLLNQSSSQAIDGSLRFDSRKSQSLTRTPGSAGNRKTWTYSSWVKTIPGALAASNHKNLLSSDNGNANNNERMHLFLGNASDKIQHDLHSSSPRVSTANYRDVSGWYHVVVKFDTTKSAAREQIAWYINGEQVVNWDTEDALSQNTDYGINGNWLHRIGSNNAAGPGQFWDGHMSQVYLIDGLALGPGYFGFTDPLTGVWRPKKFRAEGTTVNNGRVFSSTGTFTNWDDDGSYPKTELFDGTLYTGGTPNGACPDDGNPASFDFGDRRITGFQNLQINIFISSNQASATNLASVNGIDITNEIHEAGNNTWTTVDLGSKFTTLQSFTIKNNNCYVGGFIIDGVVMQDSTTQNLDFGTNGFYLPMDGNSPIGQDKSGKGNDWKPVNFGGSAGVDQATGALPILEGAGGAVANVATRTDANAANLVLALPLVGSANDVSNRINSGTTSKTVTVNGAVASSSYSNFYGGSYYFDGSDNITVADGSNHFSFGTGAYTVEGYLYPTTLTGNGDANPRFFCCGTPSASSNRNQLQIVITASGQIRLDTNGANYTSTAGDVVANRWQHIAVVRDGSGNLKSFVNGKQVLSQSSVNNNITNNDGISLGIEAGHSSRFTGYMNDVRIYKGVAKYTSNFIPASTNPDILPDSPSGVSGKSKLTKITDGAVSFEGTATSKLTLADSTDFTFGANNFCIEFYYYNNSLDGSYNIIFDCMGSNRSGIQLAFETDGDYRIEVGDGSNNWIWQSTGFDAKAKQWTHFALTREGSTFRAFENGVLLGTQTSSTAVGDPRSPAIGGYASDDSTNYGFNGYISNFRIVNGSAVYTAAFTPPERTLTNVTNTKLLCCQSTVEPGGASVAPNVSGINNGTQWSNYLTGAGGFQGSYPASKAFNGTASASETSRSTNTGQTQTFAPPAGIPYSSKVEVWTYYTGDVSLNGGSNVAVADDQDWREIASGSGTLNTLDFICDPGNSMYLGGIRIDSTTILVDPSLAPNGDAATTNFNPFNTDINTVRGQEGAFATFNPIDHRRLTNGPTYTLSRGNLTCDMVGGTNHSSGSRGFAASTYTLPTGGKWYCEFYMDSLGNDDIALGIAADEVLGYYIASGNPKPGAYMVRSSGIVYSPTFQLSSDSTRAFITGDLMGVSVDLESTDKRITFYKNGTAVYNTTVNEAQGPFKFVIGCDPGGSTAYKVTANFGQNPFKFLPSGDFQPLSSSSLRPDTVVSRSDQYVSTTLYTGNGASTPGGSGGTQNIDVKHKPDLIWIKDLTQSHNHNLVDSIRGPGSILMSDTNVGQVTDSTDAVTAFTDTGFTLGDNGEGTQSLELNKSGNSYVAWSWKAGGSSNTFNVDDIGYASAAAAGLTAGTITPTGASVGTKQGFSIIKWTDQDGVQQLPHGLSQAPDFILIKDLGSSVNWSVYHSSIGNALAVYLNNANAAFSTSRWDTKDPTSSIFYWSDNTSTNSQIAYCWHDVPGLQKFGKYEGLGGTANGSFVELGFRPAIVWVKNVDDGNANSHWCVFDNLRPGYNKSPAQNRLHLDENLTQDPDRVDDGNGIDILSNGFRVRSNNWYETNLSGATYIYCAWEEAPAIDLYGGGANAR